MPNLAEIGALNGFRVRNNNSGVRIAARNMCTMAVACYQQPEPVNKEPAELYTQFQTYRQLGRYILTGKAA